jgi:hypothetical protein
LMVDSFLAGPAGKPLSHSNGHGTGYKVLDYNDHRHSHRGAHKDRRTGSPNVLRPHLSYCFGLILPHCHAFFIFFFSS